MSDPIDRQAAIDAFADYIHDVNKLIGTRKLSVHECEDIARRVLSKLPSAQPERETGQWLVKYEDERKQIVWWECPECGQPMSWHPNFCPNCGAYLRGEQDE